MIFPIFSKHLEFGDFTLYLEVTFFWLIGVIFDKKIAFEKYIRSTVSNIAKILIKVLYVHGCNSIFRNVFAHLSHHFLNIVLLLGALW